MPELLPAIAKRRALRAFAPHEVPAEELTLLWQAASRAPSHGNTQPVRILIPGDAGQRGALEAALSEGNRSWAVAAPVLAALGVLPGHERTVSNADGSVRELWGLHAGIALGNVMTQATELGLIAHPVAGFDEASVRRAFGAPEHLRVLVVIAIGYPGDPHSLAPELRDRETTPMERQPLDRLVVHGSWGAEHGLTARDPGRKA